jgi:hypothetical protein
MIKAAGWKQLPAELRKGIERTSTGETPFLLAPFLWAAKKGLGEKKVNKVMWEHFQKPLVSADIAVGQKLQGITKALLGEKASRFWSDKKILSAGPKYTHKHRTGGVEHHLPSALAPVNKVSRFVIPVLGAAKLDEILRRRKENEQK